MANEIVPIRTVKHYIKEFAPSCVSPTADRNLIREQLLDAFSKEVFGQIVFKYKEVDPLKKSDKTLDDKTRLGIRNILHQADRKWKRLCVEFSKYKETYTLIQPNDLIEHLKEQMKLTDSEDWKEIEHA